MRLTPIIIHNLFFQFDSAKVSLVTSFYYCAHSHSKNLLLSQIIGWCLMDSTVQSFFLLASFEGVHGTVGPKEIPS